MCGIGGFCDWNRENRTWQWEKTGERMCRSLERRGPDDGGLWVGQDCVLAHRRLAVIDPENGHQPMVRRDGDGKEIVLVYNGELYNTDDLRQELTRRGHQFVTRTDTEVLLEAWREYGETMGDHLEGIYAFAIWEERTRTLFCCRDRFGVKPFFYTMVGSTFVFGSELKTLFCYPGLTPEADETTWQEVLGISPARTPGVGVFKGISELKPAHQLTVSPEGLRIRRYWNVTSRPHTEDYPETVEHLRHLLSSAIRRQLVSDVPLCTLLSGGLDSSIITAVAANAYREWGLPPLETYSFDYTDNQKYFKASSFQPDADWPWVERMREEFGTDHRILTCSQELLVSLLGAAVEAKDLPGMADVDSSLLYFCRKVAERHTVALSGECADDVFGGYPWFERSELLEADTFPWCPDLEFRRAVVKPELWESLQVEDYVQARYQQSLAEMPDLPGEALWERRRREVGWLSLNWFMSTLLDRKDRMSMAAGLEVRVPFCDHHLVEYVWNIPWAMKAMNGQRKQVLRDAVEGLLPEELLRRPKSPYPKTWNPAYLAAVSAELRRVISDPAAPLLAIIKKEALEALLASGADNPVPWYGQLMTTPQTIAWFLQVNYWMKKYRVELV